MSEDQPVIYIPSLRSKVRRRGIRHEDEAAPTLRPKWQYSNKIDKNIQQPYYGNAHLAPIVWG